MGLASLKYLNTYMSFPIDIEALTGELIIPFGLE
jgi:hypothetical protein